MKANKPVTVEEQIALMRKGSGEDLKLQIGELEIPCRLMSASEEGSIVGTARNRAKSPVEEQRKYFEGIEIQKSILEAACNVNSTPYLSKRFLDSITSAELENLYDQYITKLRIINPKFENLGAEQLVEMIRSISEKKTVSSDLYTWQLAEIGRYFLDTLLPKAKEAGSL